MATTVAEPVFLDTSLIVAASAEEHPSHQPAVVCIDALISAGAALHISPQVCREFLVTFTRGALGPRNVSVEEGLEALESWLNGCVILEETESVLRECLALAERHEVRGKQLHDCNLVATMRVHGVGKLATRNAADFRRYEGEIEVLAVD